MKVTVNTKEQFLTALGPQRRLNTRIIYHLGHLGRDRYVRNLETYKRINDLANAVLAAAAGGRVHLFQRRCDMATGFEYIAVVCR